MRDQYIFLKVIILKNTLNVLKDIIQDAYLKILRDKLLVGKNMCINLFKEEEIVNQTKNVYSELIKL